MKNEQKGGRMDLIDKVQDIANKIPKLKDVLKTEEATKNALIMPFISALGYDVFDPTEVIPEFTADVGIKKGEKVDYAIKKDENVIILFECKWSGADLTKEHFSQLHRYFHETSARFGILTNGIEYRFYSDLEESNKMDKKPFLIFDMLNFPDHQLLELKKFTKSAFSQDAIISNAIKLKYSREIKKILETQLESPEEQFIRFFASQIYNGKLTQQKMAEFQSIVKQSFNQFIKSKINDVIQSVQSKTEEQALEIEEESNNDTIVDNGIITTETEIEGFHIVKAILRETIDVNRIVMRDTKSYCGILLDDNNRKPICRLRFNSSNMYLGLFKQKNEEKILIDSVDDIYKYADNLKSTVLEYD